LSIDIEKGMGDDTLDQTAGGTDTSLVDGVAEGAGVSPDGSLEGGGPTDPQREAHLSDAVMTAMVSKAATAQTREFKANT